MEKESDLIEKKPTDESRKTKILVIEDEAEIRQLVGLLLEREGYYVQPVSDAEKALDLLKESLFDLVLVDWMLPKMNGIDFIRTIRRKNKIFVPVLILTAKGDVDSVVEGLESGADDYLTKPFEPAILRVRVSALLRRKEVNKALESNSLAKIGPMTINFETFEVLGPQGAIVLTQSEFRLLKVLYEHLGRVFSRAELIRRVQGEGVNVTGRTVDTHIFSLRKKLGPASDFIETIRSVGYRLKIH